MFAILNTQQHTHSWPKHITTTTQRMRSIVLPRYQTRIPRRQQRPAAAALRRCTQPDRASRGARRSHHSYLRRLNCLIDFGASVLIFLVARRYAIVPTKGRIQSWAFMRKCAELTGYSPFPVFCQSQMGVEMSLERIFSESLI